MHQARPYGLLITDDSPSERDLLFIDQFARQLTNIKDLSELDHLRLYKNLPDGGYVVAQDMGGNFRLIVCKKQQQPYDFVDDGLAKSYIPMLFSGVIDKALVQYDEGVELRLSKMTQRRVINYDTTQTLPNEKQKLLRFHIPYNEKIVAEFVPQQLSTLIHTQYVQQRPTWYSGAMAQVMQIVGGYGIQNMQQLPKDNAIETAQFSLPESYLEKIQNQLGNTRLPAYTGIPPKDGKFQYDYKQRRTHAVAIAESIEYNQKKEPITTKMPWLIQVSSHGVYAMPLPIIPATTTQAFQEYIEEIGDNELMSIIERFGAMPSGESFPIDEQDFHAWQRAGVIIRICDTADYYQHIAYNQTCGWSFNLNGTEAYNTCYNYNEQGIIQGHTYKLSLRFGDIEHRGYLKRHDISNQSHTKLSAYLAQLIQQLPKDSERSKAILYKIRRLSIEELEQHAENNSSIDDWDNLNLDPIATIQGNVRRVYTGFLYHHAKPKFQPQIKFPDVFLKACLSFDFSPSEPLANHIEKPLCDTVMYCYYIENQLNAVKYFYDSRGFIQETESDFEECMTVGQWTKTETTGTTSLQGHFYCTELDDRQAYPPTITTTKIIGKDLGYDKQPFFSFDYFFAKAGTLWRNRYYSHHTTTTRTNRRSLQIAICLPYFHRNAILYAYQESHLGQSKDETLQLKHIQDPTSYRYWTYDSVFAWSGSLEKMTGKPYPKNGNPVWVEIENYNPSLCSDFADQGSWINGLPHDYTWLIHPNNNEWKHSGGGGQPPLNTYHHYQYQPSEQKGKVIAHSHEEGHDLVHKNIPHFHYFTPSPDDFGNTFYRDACKVVFGESQYRNISEYQNPQQRYYWGFSRFANHQTAQHFIGVIDE